MNHGPRQDETPRRSHEHPAHGGADITRSVLLGSAGDTVSNTMAVVAQFMLESHIGIGSTYSALSTSATRQSTPSKS